MAFHYIVDVSCGIIKYYKRELKTYENLKKKNFNDVRENAESRACIVEADSINCCIY